MRVNVAGKENLSWPSFCVLCLEPEAKKRINLSFGNREFPIPYCQGCYDKVTRRERVVIDRPASVSVILGILAGVLTTIFYLLYSFFQEGGETLLDLGRWKMAIVLFWIGLGAIILLTSFLQALTQPILDFILLSLFPSKFARPGLEIVKSSNREITTYPSPGMKVKTQTPMIEELEFTNSDYAKKFCEKNGCEKGKSENSR